jgi:hypothetical protein
VNRRRLIAAVRMVALAGTVLTALACGRSEEPILDQFFGASRLRDTNALGRVSTVIFEPLQQGIVRTFHVTAVSPERPDGKLVTKDVAVDAAVVLPDGETVQKALVVTMQRQSGDDASRWIVTGFRDAAPAR